MRKYTQPVNELTSTRLLFRLLLGESDHVPHDVLCVVLFGFDDQIAAYAVRFLQ